MRNSGRLPKAARRASPRPAPGEPRAGQDIPARLAIPRIRPGDILWTCRAGFEGLLAGELRPLGGEPLGPALVRSSAWPRTPPAFARMGFPVAAVWSGAQLSEAALGSAIAGLEASPFHLQSWAPDAPLYAGLNAPAAQAQESLQGRLPGQLPSAEAARQAGGWLVQLCWLADDAAAVGKVRATEALSLSPGGRRRMWRESASPSRAAMKLEEALDWLGHQPGRGEVCVDLGAAPGGWTQRLVARGAKVIAVDPAKLTPELARHKKVVHVQDSAFAFAPEEPVDWLFCDMAWRPLEVAQLLAKWARRRWATHLVANIKLPMRDKLPILARVRQTLESAGWRNLRIRQLYHDRDEVTVTAQALSL